MKQMDKLLPLLATIIVIFLLSGCVETDMQQEEIERYKQEALQKCEGIVVSNDCYRNVADYCHKMSSKNGRDFERNAQQWEEYKTCLEINQGLFPKKYNE